MLIFFIVYIFFIQILYKIQHKDVLNKKGDFIKDHVYRVTTKAQLKCMFYF